MRLHKKLANRARKPNQLIFSETVSIFTASFRNIEGAQVGSKSIIAFTFWLSRSASVPTTEKIPLQICPFVLITFTEFPTATPISSAFTSCSTKINVSTLFSSGLYNFAANEL